MGGLRAGQRRGHPQRARGLRRGRRAALRPLRHRGGADGRRAARRRRRDRAAAARLEGPLPGDQGAGGAGGPRRQREGFETVVVRPRFVWGKGDTTLLPEMVKTVEAGKFAWVGGGRNVTDTAHVDNVVEGLLLGAEKGGPGRPTSSPTASRSSSASSSPRCSRPRASSRPTAACPPGRRRRWPASARRPGSCCRSGEPPMTRFRSWILTQECTIDISKAREELGYEPLVSHEQGLAEMRAESHLALHSRSTADSTKREPLAPGSFSRLRRWRGGARARRPSASCAARRSGPAGAGRRTRASRPRARARPRRRGGP